MIIVMSLPLKWEGLVGRFVRGCASERLGMASEGRKLANENARSGMKGSMFN